MSFTQSCNNGGRKCFFSTSPPLPCLQTSKQLGKAGLLGNKVDKALSRPRLITSRISEGSSRGNRKKLEKRYVPLEVGGWGQVMELGHQPRKFSATHYLYCGVRAMGLFCLLGGFLITSGSKPFCVMDRSWLLSCRSGSKGVRCNVSHCPSLPLCGTAAGEHGKNRSGPWVQEFKKQRFIRLGAMLILSLIMKVLSVTVFWAEKCDIEWK